MEEYFVIRGKIDLGRRYHSFWFYLSLFYCLIEKRDNRGALKTPFEKVLEEIVDSYFDVCFI